ncbi:hypothetical protein NNJEOMEG_02629 [Fundidesulfovibrio magnetotacticus]|uniref:Uncharacterized protein n=1 Tax=Fundidesulfovibrio magnetotacticus TaxID=2730080 RepID=A0A6V8LW06_9BACT|nr:hypothetical protein [Fundidesulfovibrio magnetotacticus]GFK94781.1 hypothetical protein NNJEOMEG_02629 [Fundidesulfovibrio magnetotacticus]
MKYIIFEDFAGHPAPILFPARVSHGEMRELVPYSTVLSAGYVEHAGGSLRVHGHSVSLGAKARPEDLAVIERHLAPEA